MASKDTPGNIGGERILLGFRCAIYTSVCRSDHDGLSTSMDGLLQGQAILLPLGFNLGMLLSVNKLWLFKKSYIGFKESIGQFFQD